MGCGIAQVALQAGYRVILIDSQPQQLDKAQAVIHQRAADKEQQLSCTTELARVATADLIIETVSEDLAVKREIFSGLSQHKKAKAILASNTSSLSITKLASFTAHPQQVIGIHFMNPAPVIPLVEIIRGLQTDEATFTQSCQWVKQLGKTIVVSQDQPGFIVNRLLIPMINEAIFLLHEGVALPQEIDTAMREVTGNSMGPLQIADLIGLDTCLGIMQVLQKELGADKYRPCPLLQQYVDAGWLGRKIGRGFYTYTNQ
jgi:3-hydroxybutyryl-CoA dehydrogenase